MRYMLLIYGDESGWANASEADQQAQMAEWFGYTEELRTAGVSELGDALQPTATATTRERNGGGEPLVTDGPFAETKEQLGGFYMLDVANLDEAIKWAHKCPGAQLRHDRAAADPGVPGGLTAPARNPAADAVARCFRAEFGRAVAILARGLGGDVDRAEEAMQDAYAVALERWPRDGVPSAPAAWILTTAKRRAIDRLRREAALRDKQALLARDLEEAVRDLPGEDEEMIPDERLGLMFACCHPALALEAQVPLTLRLVGGLTVPEIARALLLPEATVAQRLVRAKRKVRAVGHPDRGAAARRAAGAAGRRARRALPRLQRGLRRDRRRRARARRPRRRGDPARARRRTCCCRTSPSRPGCSR